jgi:hypothetical protein
VKPIALDICCREGGATKGLQRAGFHVIGVDIEPRKNYPGDEFWQMDGVYALREMTLPFGKRWPAPALIFQGWPCQEANTATAGNRAKGLKDNHVQFIPEARALSDRIGIPYVLEQPTASRTGHIRRDLTLCMDMFKGELPPPWVQKHRSFEIHGFTVPQPVHPAGPVRGGSMAGFPKPAGHATRVRGYRHGAYYEGDYVAAYGKGGYKGEPREIAHAMRIDWMYRDGMVGQEKEAARFDLCEAIPPAFAEYIGRAFLESPVRPTLAR